MNVLRPSVWIHINTRNVRNVKHKANQYLMLKGCLSCLSRLHMNHHLLIPINKTVEVLFWKRPCLTQLVCLCVCVCCFLPPLCTSTNFGLRSMRTVFHHLYLRGCETENESTFIKCLHLYITFRTKSWLPTLLDPIVPRHFSFSTRFAPVVNVSEKKKGNADVGDVVESPVAFAEDSHASFISSRLRQDLNLKRGLSSHWYTPATFVWLWCCNPNCVHVSLNGTKDRISLSFFLALIKLFSSFNAFYFLFIDALTQFSMRRSTGSIYLWYNVIEKLMLEK